MNIIDHFKPKQEWGWNSLANCVVRLVSGWRINGASAKARVVTDDIDFSNKTLILKIKGAPAVDPGFDKGFWIMLTKDGQETGEELDLLEMMREGGNGKGRSAAISFRHKQGIIGDMHWFDIGAFDEYTVEAVFNDTCVNVFVKSRDVFLTTFTFYIQIKTGILKAGCFAIDDKFLFKRVADRGPLFMDLVYAELK